MKHLRTISQRPPKAQDISIGQYLSIFAQLLGLIASFLTDKDV